MINENKPWLLRGGYFARIETSGIYAGGPDNGWENLNFSFRNPMTTKEKDFCRVYLLKTHKRSKSKGEIASFFYMLFENTCLLCYNEKETR